MSRSKAQAYIRARARRERSEVGRVDDDAERLRRDVKLAILSTGSKYWSEKAHKKALRRFQKAASVFGRRVQEEALESGISEWQHAVEHHVGTIGGLSMEDVEPAREGAEQEIERLLIDTGISVGEYLTGALSKMSEAAAAGRSIQAAQRLMVEKVAKAISNSIKKKARARGATEVVTVMTDASTIAADDAARAAVKKSKKSKKKKKRTRLYKEWVTDSGNVCEDCAEVDGERVRHDEEFSNGEEGPTLHPNCRCSLLLTRE